MRAAETVAGDDSSAVAMAVARRDRPQACTTRAGGARRLSLRIRRRGEDGADHGAPGDAPALHPGRHRGGPGDGGARRHPRSSEVEDQVEAVRGLAYERPVNVEPITTEEMDRRLREVLRRVLPEAVLRPPERGMGDDRRDPAGRRGSSRRSNAYQQGQVLGFYNSQNEELVYTATPTSTGSSTSCWRTSSRTRSTTSTSTSTGSTTWSSGATTRRSRRRSASWRGARTTSRRQVLFRFPAWLGDRLALRRGRPARCRP